MPPADLVYRAIAHPARRRILSLLAISARSVKELTTEFAMSQPAVSQHLRELRNAALVRAERVGAESRYSLTPKPLEQVTRWSQKMCGVMDPAGHAWAFTGGSAKEGRAKGRP